MKYIKTPSYAAARDLISIINLYKVKARASVMRNFLGAKPLKKGTVK